MQLLHAGVLSLALCLVLVSESLAAERLSRAHLLKLFPGTYSGIAKDGTRVRIQGRSDGRIHGIADGKHDQGRWTVEGNRLCIKWSFWLGGKKRCGHVLRDGPWYVAVKSNGKTQMRFRR